MIGKIVLFVFCGLLFSLSAQDTIKVRPVKVLPVPSFGFSPETNAYVGAVALFTIDAYQDTITRSSNAKLEFLYTWNRQLILDSEWSYFFREEKWFTQGNVHFSKYPDRYYGIGSDTRNEDKVIFFSNRARIDLHLLYKIRDPLFIGFGILFNDYSEVEYDESTVHYEELNSARNYGVKFMVRNDARNNILSASRGSYFEILNKLNRANSVYNTVSLDARKYVEKGERKQHVLAGRFFHNSVFGTPGFYDYSLLGGDRLARGYLYGRFRDKHLTTLQLEYRALILCRIGIAAFGGISGVYQDFTNWNAQNIKPNLGGGIRFLVDKRENTYLRFDYAIGVSKQSGFYVSFGESF